MARKSKVLEEIISLDEFSEKVENIEVLEPDVIFIQKINDNAMMIIDERISGYVLHSVESILLLIIFAVIANCNTFTEIYIFGCTYFEWLNKYIEFENGLPSLSTIKRVISFINPKELESILVESVRTFNENNKPIYQLGLFKIEDIKTTDGKTANSSDRKTSKNGEVKKMNAMSVYSVKNEICEATEFIDDKTNEIPMCPEILKRINIKDNIIVFDALNTQKETIKYIFDKEAYYVAPVKGNHKILYEELNDYFNNQEFVDKIKENNYKKTIEKRNGDAEVREYGFTNDVSWIYGKSEWKGLKSVGYAKRTYKNVQGKTVSDTRYYISNLNASLIDVISLAIRSEWKIENNLHYYLDMVFKEDNNTSFIQNTQKNLNIIRKFSLALLKNYKQKTKLSMHSIRFLINMNFEKEINKILSV
ncbi:MAG: ISAs1 family transposase [Bacilli bacterium]|nr:ISAs1 family transposase [Bacilli bacterium]